MILSKYFVFIHCPKTGGSFVRHLCATYAPAEWEIKILKGHPTFNDIPEKYKHLPVFGFVRNPFDLYVSWYFYGKKHKKSPLLNIVSNHGTKSFKDTIICLNNYYLESPCNHVLHSIYGDNLDLIKIGKFENLREELFKIMKNIVKLPEEFERQILTHPKVNQSERGNYQDFYDQELRTFVSEREKNFLDYFDYKF